KGYASTSAAVFPFQAHNAEPSGKSWSDGGSLDIENYCTLRGAWPFEAPLISGRTARILK
ncbi:hypothetical protein, partial [Escherichia coli]